MKIKVIASNPVDIQDGIQELIEKEFETIPYREFEEDIRKEMKNLGEVGIRFKGYPYVLNKDEYEVIQ